MAGITFGSVGDIIAVGQIVCALAQALGDSKGSAQGYQSLRRDLETFDQALLQVIALWQNYEESPELEQLGKVTKETVKEWKNVLLKFRIKVDKKYGTSLCPGGSGNWLKDAGKKVLWVNEKEEVAELRAKLQGASDTITMLVLAAIGKSNKLAESKQEARVECVHAMLQESIRLAEEQMYQLRLIEEKLDLQAEMTEIILTKVQSSEDYLSRVPSIAIDMKSLLSLLRYHLNNQQSTPRGLGTQWKQAPVTLEDALGFLIPLPLELVNSWEILNMILSQRFKNHKGHSKVLNGEFVIQDDTTGTEIEREFDWSMSLRPGQKVDMSVVFKERDVDINSCPRCKTTSEASLDDRIQCLNQDCKMWFQRVVEIEEDSEEAEVAVFDKTTPKPRDLSLAPTNRIKRRSKEVVILPGDFQRVRLLTQPLNNDEQEVVTWEDGYQPGPMPSRRPVIDPRPGKTSDRSQWTRISSNHVSMETLLKYRVDWDFDESSDDYFILKRKVPERELQFLMTESQKGWEEKGRRSYTGVEDLKIDVEYDSSNDAVKDRHGTFVCRGETSAFVHRDRTRLGSELKNGGKWGCGLEFPTSLALERHLYFGDGVSCNDITSRIVERFGPMPISKG